MINVLMLGLTGVKSEVIGGWRKLYNEELHDGVAHQILYG
jgi:hypothetical protein